jgi:hypothetical protein
MAVVRLGEGNAGEGGCWVVGMIGEVVREEHLIDALLLVVTSGLGNGWGKLLPSRRPR